jgi:CRP-like cAMP-binding protein
MATDNVLLANLPEAAQQRLRPRLVPVSLRTGDILPAPGDEIRYAFFLTAGLVSLEYAGADGDTVELAIVGRDGMVGIPLVLHDLALPYRAVVRARSAALRVRASVLQGEWQASREVHNALLGYAGRVLNQVSQAALCRQGHTVLQRLCRWLVTAQDHLGSQPIEVTQETLARALGIARPVVTKALLELQGADAIWCPYARIVIRKRPMLESTVCECYQVTRLNLDVTAAVGGACADATAANRLRLSQRHFGAASCSGRKPGLPLASDSGSPSTGLKQSQPRKSALRRAAARAIPMAGSRRLRRVRSGDFRRCDRLCSIDLNTLVGNPLRIKADGPQRS